MRVTSAKEIKDRLHAACCKCREVRETVEQQRVLRESMDAGHGPTEKTVNPGPSFSAVPNKG
jgi:hypothetical protein